MTEPLHFGSVLRRQILLTFHASETLQENVNNTLFKAKWKLQGLRTGNSVYKSISGSPARTCCLLQVELWCLTLSHKDIFLRKRCAEIFFRAW